MASAWGFRLLSVVFFSLLLLRPATAAPRRLAAVDNGPPLVLKHHGGALLKGNVTVNVLWYGKFSPSQRAIVVDFLLSLAAPSRRQPSVYSWWATTAFYGSRKTDIALGRQVLDEGYSLGKSLTSADLVNLAGKVGGGGNTVAVILTADDVAVEGFCRSRCGTHGVRGKREAFVWVGNSAGQCPGLCAWPFHRPVFGPQTPPLVAPNGDVGADGMVINLAALLAGTATNPFGDGFFQGPREAPLEAASACAGIFGSGAYPGYPGKTLEDGAADGSYNANGVGGRRYLLPAMWDPRTSRCSTLV